MGIGNWWGRLWGGEEQKALGSREVTLKRLEELFEGWRGLEAILGQIKFTEANDLWGDFTQEEGQKVFGKHALVYACVGKIIGAFSEAQPEIGRDIPGSSGDGKVKWEPIKNHPAAEIMRRPNPDLSRILFDDYRLIHKLTAGQSFVWKWRNGLGEVAELWPVPPNCVRVIPPRQAADGSRLVAVFSVSLPGMSKPVPVLPQDMIWDRFVDPLNLAGCLPPLQSAYHAYRLDSEKDDYIIEMMENYDAPSVVYETEADLKDKEKAAFRAALREITGKQTKKRGSGLLLDNKITAKTLSPPLQDLDWPGLGSMTDSQICAAFGVPPLLVHARVAQENSPLSSPNLEAAEQVFYRGTMLSHWRRDEVALTDGLLSDLRWRRKFPDARIRYNLDGIRALLDDLKELTAHCTEAVKLGILTIEEARVMLGKPPERDGTYLLPTGMAEVRPGEPSLPFGGHGEGNDEAL